MTESGGEARDGGSATLLEAQQYASQAERRLFLRAVLGMRSDMTGSQIITLALSELAEFIGVAADAVAEIAERVAARVVSIVDGRTGEHARSGLIGVRWRSGGGQIDIEVPQVLASYMLELKSRFSVGELEARMGLVREHARRLYEILRRRLREAGDSPTKVRIEMGVAELQRELGVAGRYGGRFNNFRQRVIERACEEISRDSDLKVTFWVASGEDNKRRAAAIVFEVTERQRTRPEDTALAGRLIGAGLSRADAAQMIEVYGASDRDRVTWHLDELERRLKRGAIRSSPAGWLKVAVREDYRPQASGLESRIKAERTQRQQAHLRSVAQAKAVEQATAAREEKVQAAIAAVIDRLTPRQREAWTSEVADALGSAAFKRSWARQHDFTMPMFRTAVAGVIARHTGQNVREKQAGRAPSG